jgi:hypothetical protein
MPFPYRVLFILLVLAAAAPSAIPQTPDVLPEVVEHQLPTYPPLARTARVEGDVHIKITTDGESVRDAEVEDGPPLLRKAAEENVRTWKFASHAPGIFHIIFRYKLMSGAVEVVFPGSTSIVEIVAAPPQISIYYSDVGLGKWKAHLYGPHGPSYIFELYYSGPNDDEWVDGQILGPNGKSEEIDYGHIKDGLFGFTVNLRQHNGSRVSTFFAGKINKNKITGTFVDNAGMTGEWTAVRQR